MDYVLVSYLVAEKTALSYAVGEWARVWPLQTLFRAMGAYFIRRDSRSPLYRKVLERYVAMATAGGVTQAVYPEGGLSRDGRLRPPRLGILDYMVRSFDPAGRDLVFVPVGLNYDRVLEDRTLLRDLDPSAVKPGTARAALSTLAFTGKNLLLIVRNRWRRFGYACVHLGTPVSLAAWVKGRGFDPRSLSPEDRKGRVAELAADLMSAIARVIPVLPVPLVATVFSRAPGRAFTELELKTEVLPEEEHGGFALHVSRETNGVTRKAVVDATFLGGFDVRRAGELAALLDGFLEGPYVLRRKDDEHRVATLAEAAGAILDSAKKGLTASRYKGLGEMNPETLWETTMNPATRRLLQVRVEDAVEADELFTILMGDAVEPRRNFIEANALAATNLDI